MVTVYESIALWLNGIFADPNNGFTDTLVLIDIDNLQESFSAQGVPAQVTGLYSSPNDIQKPMMAGQVKNIIFRAFYVRRDFKTLEIRKNNEVFFEKLKKAIREKNLKWSMPKDGRKWRSIIYTGGVFPSQRAENNDWAIYQVNLKAEYIEY